MKKVLFATSALVMSAGFAAAEVAVSGDGRMGMIYDGDDVQFASRARVLFTLTGESDAGLSFGGKFRVDQESWATEGRSAARGSRGEVWVSGTYGKLSMGDVVGASEAAIGDLYELGYTDGEVAGDREEISYLVGDGANRDQGPTALYEYSIDNISFYASTTDGVTRSWGDLTEGSDSVNAAGNDAGEVAYSLAAKYDAGNWWAALGYSKHGDADEIIVGAEGKFDQFSVKGAYAKYSDRSSELGAGYEYDSMIGLAAAYNMDALTDKGFWRQDKHDSIVAGVSNEKYDSFGIGADYELGGGATLAGAIIDTDYLDDTVADIGVKFKF